MESFVDGLAEDFLGVVVDHGNEVAAFPTAVGDDAGAGGDGTDFPAFADWIGGGLQTFVRPELVAAPDHGVEVWFKQ